jgi:hypothetical protein
MVTKHGQPKRVPTERNNRQGWKVLKSCVARLSKVPPYYTYKAAHLHSIFLAQVRPKVYVMYLGRVQGSEIDLNPIETLHRLPSIAIVFHHMVK